MGKEGAMAIDLTQRPQVEYDDSGSGTLTVSWMTEDKQKMFSVVLVDGAIVGVNTKLGSNGPKPWKIKLPKGALRINCNAFLEH
jgi:hypothetical protein